MVTDDVTCLLLPTVAVSMDEAGVGEVVGMTESSVVAEFVVVVVCVVESVVAVVVEVVVDVVEELRTIILPLCCCGCFLASYDCISKIEEKTARRSAFLTI